MCDVAAGRCDMKTQDLHLLTLGNDPIAHTTLKPATDAGSDRIPVAATLGQAAPFAAMRDHRYKGIAHVSLAAADLAPGNRKAVCDEGVLFLRDFHRATHPIGAYQC